MTTAENIREIYDGGYIRQAFDYAMSKCLGYEYEGSDNGRKYLRFWFADNSEWKPR